ncbi:MAG TPA: hypothetical protein VN132_16135, partial [Bdellovibrio sp.]|nr:hypothetical protein [Bdellovibrio sp.]
RNYKFDYRKGTIEFRGLQLENSGTPHEGLVGGNPHEGFVAGNKPISLEDHDLGYASLIVSDLSVLQYFEPAVAKALREAKAQKIFIAAIDNKPIHNEFEFLQVVGECQSCKITRYWVQVENPQDISNKNLRVIALTTKLVDVLDQSKLDREFVSETIAQIKVFHTALSQKQQEAEQGLSNPKTNEQVSAYWEKVEQHLDKIFQPEDLIELLNQIRREL